MQRSSQTIGLIAGALAKAQIELANGHKIRCSELVFGAGSALQLQVEKGR